MILEQEGMNISGKSNLLIRLTIESDDVGKFCTNGGQRVGGVAMVDPSHHRATIEDDHERLEHVAFACPFAVVFDDS